MTMNLLRYHFIFQYDTSKCIMWYFISSMFMWYLKYLIYIFFWYFNQTKFDTIHRTKLSSISLRYHITKSYIHNVPISCYPKENNQTNWSQMGWEVCIGRLGLDMNMIPFWIMIQTYKKDFVQNCQAHTSNRIYFSYITCLRWLDTPQLFGWHSPSQLLLVREQRDKFF